MIIESGFKIYVRGDLLLKTRDAQVYADMCCALTKAGVRFDGEMTVPQRQPWWRGVLLF